ncbi:MAG: hypothetical protein PVG20_09910 [Thioalkalispiraceae bacterium]|jgi:nucleoside-diphosphate-sugar epimerase
MARAVRVRQCFYAWRKCLVPLIAGGEQRIQPVHIDDLVAVVMKCLDTSPSRLTIDVVGQRAMSFAEWLQKLRGKNGSENNLF